MLVLDLVVIVTIPAAAPMARITPLFDFHEQYFERQPFVGEDAREVDELFKNIEQRFLFWTAAARDDLATFALALHQVFADDDRFDDEDFVLFEQRFDFVADG